jgi:sugar (pentulose or hexulose) kinase
MPVSVGGVVVTLAGHPGAAAICGQGVAAAGSTSVSTAAIAAVAAEEKARRRMRSRP